MVKEEIGERRRCVILGRRLAFFKWEIKMADRRSSAYDVFNAGFVMNGRVSRVGFSASTWAGFMEAFECGKEACSAGNAASGTLDSDV